MANFGAEVSADTDFESDDVSLPKIEVMTPERCLASLSFASERFQDVGLLIFDECHLLAPAAGSFRRSLDGMLCVMAFQKAVPTADFLFMSAMLLNGSEFSNWIELLTGRKCLYVSLLWKPSRQARGVVVYDNADFYSSLDAAAKTQAAVDKKKGKKARDLGVKALEKLAVKPYSIWGLRHNWLNKARSYLKIEI